MTARTMPPLLPLPSELRAALQAAANRLAGAAPLLDSEVDVHAFVAQLEECWPLFLKNSAVLS